jgi:hypothetical protein
VKTLPRKALIGLVICVAFSFGASAVAAEGKAKTAASAKPPAKVSAKPAPARGERTAVIGQVWLNDAWHEAEAFVVMPGKTVEVRLLCPDAAPVSNLSDVVGPPAKGTERTFALSRSLEYRWKIPLGIVESLSESQIEWQAPAAPGHYKITCEVEGKSAFRYAAGEAGEKSRDLPALHASKVFHFLVPFELDPEGRGVIQGYPIGAYPNEKGRDVKAVIADHSDRYQPPRWFVAVTTETRELLVSEHFRLREFVPNAPNDTTVYFPYNADLVRVLEAVLADLKTSETAEPHLRILRGYVSPYEAERMRRQGARLLVWNRYQYGDGVLVIANRDAGMKMGDLNGDGKVDVRDAEALSRIITRVQKRLGLSGWIGVYAERPDKTLPETPMVGFDLRGWWAESYSADPSLGGE